MVNPGDVVTVLFPGAHTTKRRPAVVVSSAEYHRTRPDVIVGVLTTQTARATGPTDYQLLDWSSAGLRAPTAFRSFLLTFPATEVTVIGKLPPRDWQEVQSRLGTAVSVRTLDTDTAEQEQKLKEEALKELAETQARLIVAHTEQEAEQVAKEEALLKAEAERLKAEKLAAKLKELGLDPDAL